MSAIELEIKQLIVDSLELEDISASEISSDEPLFGDGLGLDSIDALELGVAIRKRFGIKIETVTHDVKSHFATVRNLALFITAQRSAT